MNKTLKCLIVFLLVTLFSVSVFATEVLENTVNYDDQIMLISEDEGAFIPEEWRRGALLDENSINGNVFEAKDEYTLEGKTVNGDMFVFAEKVSLKNVTVNGNMFIFSDTAELNFVGVTGSIYAFALEFDLSEVNVQGNIYSMSEKLSLENTQNVITNDMLSYAEELNVKSFIGRDLCVAGNEVKILDGTTVGGNLSYIANDDVEVEIAPGVIVKGSTSAVESDEEVVTQEPKSDVQSTVSSILANTITAGMGLILIVVLSDKLVAQAKQKPAGSNLLKLLGKGFVVFAAMIILMVILLFTVVGIPVSLMLLLVFIIFVFISKGVTSVVIASIVSKDRNLTKVQLYGLSLVVVLVITTLETLFTGMIGFLISLFIIFVGFGATYNAFFKKLNTEKSNDKAVVAEVIETKEVTTNESTEDDILNKIDEIDPLEEDEDKK